MINSCRVVVILQPAGQSVNYRGGAKNMIDDITNSQSRRRNINLDVSYMTRSLEVSESPLNTTRMHTRTYTHRQTHTYANTHSHTDTHTH